MRALLADGAGLAPRLQSESGTMPLSENEVHLWLADCFDPDSYGRLQAPYQALLNAEEIERRARYRRADDRQRYLVARALVRYTLSRYVPVAPQDWRFCKGAHDKPEIEYPTLDLPLSLRFNLSHSGNWAVCAVALGEDVGVDIECTTRNNDVLSIARHFFSSRELGDLQGLAGSAASDRFFDLWTLKEAYMKARGEGISLGLGNFSFEFSASPSGGRAIGVHFAEILHDDPQAWRFWVYEPAPDYRLALGWNSGSPAGDTAVRCFLTKPGVGSAECRWPLRASTC